MTNGGLGIAFFCPLSNNRYFFPFRPIQVSPIGITSFFSEWGFRVLVSEAVWILVPALTVGILGVFVRKFFEKTTR
jgi:inner membrane protein